MVTPPNATQRKGFYPQCLLLALFPLSNAGIADKTLYVGQ